MMRGIGEILSAPIALPKLPAVLVNPGVAVPTAGVFKALAARRAVNQPSADGAIGCGPEIVRRRTLHRRHLQRRNDLEAPAISLQPVIAEC